MELLDFRQKVDTNTMSWFILTLLMAVSVVSGYGTEYVSCENDAQCSSSEFCYVSGLCVPCLDCATYHRHAPTYIDCIKDAKQCGGCIDGWKDDIFTNGERRDSCIKTRVHFKEISQAESYKSDPVFRLVEIGELLLLTLAVSVFIIGGLLWCRTNWAKPKPGRVSPHNLLSEGLPRCAQPARATTHFWEHPAGATAASQLSDTPQTSRSGTSRAASGVVHTTIFNAEGFKEAQQQAVPFRWPRCQDTESEAEDPDVQTAPPPQSPDLSFLHDEDTMPSSWSPNDHSTSTASNPDTAPLVSDAAAGSSGNDAGPQPKRARVGNSESDSGIDVFQAVSNQEALTEEVGINLYITNNVVIRKA